LQKCSNAKEITKIVIYSTAFIVLIDLIILLTLSLITILRNALGDGLSLSILIFMGLFIIYGLYMISRRLLNM